MTENGAKKTNKFTYLSVTDGSMDVAKELFDEKTQQDLDNNKYDNYGIVQYAKEAFEMVFTGGEANLRYNLNPSFFRSSYLVSGYIREVIANKYISAYKLAKDGPEVPLKPWTYSKLSNKVGNYTFQNEPVYLMKGGFAKTKVSGSRTSLRKGSLTCEYNYGWADTVFKDLSFEMSTGFSANGSFERFAYFGKFTPGGKQHSMAEGETRETPSESTARESVIENDKTSEEPGYQLYYKQPIRGEYEIRAYIGTLKKNKKDGSDALYYVATSATFESRMFPKVEHLGLEHREKRPAKIENVYQGKYQNDKPKYEEVGNKQITKMSIHGIQETDETTAYASKEVDDLVTTKKDRIYNECYKSTMENTQDSGRTYVAEYTLHLESQRPESEKVEEYKKGTETTQSETQATMVKFKEELKMAEGRAWDLKEGFPKKKSYIEITKEGQKDTGAPYGFLTFVDSKGKGFLFKDDQYDKETDYTLDMFKKLKVASVVWQPYFKSPVIREFYISPPVFTNSAFGDLPGRYWESFKGQKNRMGFSFVGSKAESGISLFDQSVLLGDLIEQPTLVNEKMLHRQGVHDVIWLPDGAEGEAVKEKMTERSFAAGGGSTRATLADAQKEYKNMPSDQKKKLKPTTIMTTYSDYKDRNLFGEIKTVLCEGALDIRSFYTGNTKVTLWKQQYLKPEALEKLYELAKYEGCNAEAKKKLVTEVVTYKIEGKDRKQLEMAKATMDRGKDKSMVGDNQPQINNKNSMVVTEG